MATYLVPSNLPLIGNITVPAGFDVLDFGRLSAGIVADAGLESARLAGSGHVVVRWSDDVSRIYGTAHADRLSAEDGEDLFGRAGRDVLRDGGNAEHGSTMRGGLDNDTFHVGAIGSRAFGESGNDAFYLKGAIGATISGGDGADRVHAIGGSGLDLFGGSGGERIVLHGVANARLSTGDGDDVIDVRGGTNLRVKSGAGDDRVALSGTDDARISCGSGADRVAIKSSDGDWIWGGAGNDRILIAEGTTGHHVAAGAGIDTLVYWNTRAGTSDNVTLDLRDGVLQADGATVARVSGFERVSTEDGDDRLIGSDGANVLSGGGGEDRLFGLEGDDLIFGGAGDDYIYAGGGQDVVNGGAGDDYFKGGRDGDRFVFNDLNAGEVDTLSIFGRLDRLDFRGAVDSLGDLKIKIHADDSATVTIKVDGGVHTVRIEDLLDTHYLTDQLASHVLVG